MEIYNKDCDECFEEIGEYGIKQEYGKKRSKKSAGKNYYRGY